MDLIEDRVKDLIDYALSLGESLGASYVEARAQVISSEYVMADNGVIKEYSRNVRAGVGVRVLYMCRYGFSATNDLSREAVGEAVRRAISAAKVTEDVVRPAERRVVRDSRSSPVKRDPTSVSPEDKVELVLEANKEALSLNSIKSSVTSLSVVSDYRYVKASDGAEVSVKVSSCGMGQVSVAAESGLMERVHDIKGGVGGWELIEGVDWPSFARSVSELALKAVKSGTPPAGKFRVIADPDLIGLILHEAFGHATEGDLVYTGGSVLARRLGTQVASPLVTIVDEGVVKGGYYVPYDDEGSPKGRTVVVEGGVLKTYLTDRVSASKLGIDVTGNGRAQDFASTPIVRQTNFYMLGGDWRLEEMIEDIDYGIYLIGRSAGGGQVDPANGTFTFSIGPSRIIRKGELAELVRGVVVSGNILETLKGVEAVGRDVKVRTSPFSRCGKGGQMVTVGLGGPHVRIKEMIIGGR